MSIILCGEGLKPRPGHGRSWSRTGREAAVREPNTLPSSPSHTSISEFLASDLSREILMDMYVHRYFLILHFSLVPCLLQTLSSIGLSVPPFCLHFSSPFLVPHLLLPQPRFLSHLLAAGVLLDLPSALFYTLTLPPQKWVLSFSGMSAPPRLTSQGRISLINSNMSMIKDIETQTCYIS